MNPNPLRPIFYDTETTGVRPEKDRIIEIACFDPVQNRTFSMLVNPGCPIPPEATAIHHITDEMVEKAPSFAEAGQKMIEFCLGNVVLIAHNNDSFDMPFIRNELARHQIEMPNWNFVDSLKWSRRYRSDLPRHSLQFLRETYRIQANTAHRALDDVMILHQVFSLMVDDLPMEQVLELSKSSKKLQHMPFGKYQGKPLKEVPSDYIKWLKKNGALDKPENKELKAAFESYGTLVAS